MNDCRAHKLMRASPLALLLRCLVYKNLHILTLTRFWAVLSHSGVLALRTATYLTKSVDSQMDCGTARYKWPTPPIKINQCINIMGTSYGADVNSLEQHVCST